MLYNVNGKVYRLVTRNELFSKCNKDEEMPYIVAEEVKVSDTVYTVNGKLYKLVKKDTIARCADCPLWGGGDTVCKAHKLKIREICVESDYYIAEEVSDLKDSMCNGIVKDVEISLKDNSNNISVKYIKDRITYQLSIDNLEHNMAVKSIGNLITLLQEVKKEFNNV
jgi:hypothetical protein